MIDNVLDLNSDLTLGHLAQFIQEVAYPCKTRMVNRPTWRRDRHGEWTLYAHIGADRDIARDLAVGFLDFMPDDVSVEVARDSQRRSDGGYFIHLTVRQ